MYGDVDNNQFETCRCIFNNYRLHMVQQDTI